MTVDVQATLAWLKEVAEKADDDLPLLNALARKSPALQYYYINVHKLKSVTPEQFAREMPGHVQEAARLRRETEVVDTVEAQDARLTSIEAQLTELKGLLVEALQQQKPAGQPAEVISPTTKKGKKAEEKPEVETTEAVDDSAESEA